MQKPLSLPQGHHFIETADGSFTFFSDRFQEACHSTNGAKSETILHYIEGCQILNKLKSKDYICILEVGFGLGIGFLTTLEKLPPQKKINFISLEIDKDLLNWFKSAKPEFTFLWEQNLFKATGSNFELTVIQGDARIVLPKFLEKNPTTFDAIYQDAFSPKKNPTLWTKEWFELLKKYSAKDVILSTYSASTSIRKALHEVGFGVLKGEKFGPKRTSTRAVLNQPTDPEILLQLERSPALALTDLQIDPDTGKMKG